jgi:hypothetical protein
MLVRGIGDSAVSDVHCCAGGGHVEVLQVLGIDSSRWALNARELSIYWQ